MRRLWDLQVVPPGSAGRRIAGGDAFTACTVSDSGSESGHSRLPAPALDRFGPAAEIDRHPREIRIGVYILFTWVHFRNPLIAKGSGIPATVS